MRKTPFLVSALLLAAACAAKTHPTPDTTLSGTAALSTFPSAPSAVRVVDESGHALSAPIAVDGRFSLSLPAGHTYKVFLSAANDVPLVFPRQTGVLDTTFLLKGKGADLALGNLRYMAAAPTGGFKVTAQAPSGQHDDEVEDDGSASCEDGSRGSSSNAAEADSPDNRADGTKEMAVGVHDVPNEVDGCDHQSENETESGN